VTATSIVPVLHFSTWPPCRKRARRRNKIIKQQALPDQHYSTNLGFVFIEQPAEAVAGDRRYRSVDPGGASVQVVTYRSKEAKARQSAATLPRPSEVDWGRSVCPGWGPSELRQGW
jgi:hypothetical protein